MRIAVLLTCHNRREATLRCLAGLVPQLGEADRVFLVDDGSTDDTDAAVRTRYPSVRVIPGDGSLYWAKGMALAWGVARQTGVAFDGFLWLNDDVRLSPQALAVLDKLSSVHPDAVLVGELENARGEIVYGIRGDLFTGNFVFVPHGVSEKVGMICGDYAHAWADSDYAMRCKRVGVPVVSCGIVGTCEWHPNRPSLKGLCLRERWVMLFNPKGWNLHDLWLYRRRNWGVCVAVFSCVHMILHVIAGEGER